VAEGQEPEVRVSEVQPVHAAAPEETEEPPGKKPELAELDPLRGLERVVKLGERELGQGYPPDVESVIAVLRAMGTADLVEDGLEPRVG